ncbi:MAG: hypothetical protein Fur0041_15800 [Bacteroidia bacterium]
MLLALSMKGQDTLSADVPQGVIVVKKPVIQPFVKVGYSLYLSSVTLVDVEVPANNGVDGAVEMDRVPVFDSGAYSQKWERVYPQKQIHLSKHFSDKLHYNYAPSDTPRIDTMVVGLWITKSGKIKWKAVDTVLSDDMPPALEDQLYAAVKLLPEVWGQGGGFNTPRRFLKPSRFYGESYYCEMFVIVSTFPLTQVQQNTGVLAAPFDTPLNSPPSDKQQEQFIRKQ